jgi:Cu+-exporting ATPase
MKPQENSSFAIDPICWMKVDPSAPRGGSWEYQGKTYHFCNPDCREEFQKSPDKYLALLPSGPLPEPPAPVIIDGATYTCPMHPEIVTDHFDTCPKCGMALEPMVPTLEDGPSPELVDMSRRMRFGILLGAPVFALAMGEGSYARLCPLGSNRRVGPIERGASRRLLCP